MTSAVLGQTYTIKGIEVVAAPYLGEKNVCKGCVFEKNYPKCHGDFHEEQVICNAYIFIRAGTSKARRVILEAVEAKLTGNV